MTLKKKINELIYQTLGEFFPDCRLITSGSDPIGWTLQNSSGEIVVSFLLPFGKDKQFNDDYFRLKAEFLAQLLTNLDRKKF